MNARIVVLPSGSAFRRTVGRRSGRLIDRFIPQDGQPRTNCVAVSFTRGSTQLDGSGAVTVFPVGKAWCTQALRRTRRLAKERAALAEQTKTEGSDES
ncbi:MAG: hypothetical protein QM756_26525 [Polyangiaceae bacterium]